MTDFTRKYSDEAGPTYVKTPMGGLVLAQSLSVDEKRRAVRSNMKPISARCAML
jgi:hypothetical protein